MIHKYVLPLVAVGALIFAITYVMGNRTTGAPAEPYQTPAAKPTDLVLAGSGIVEPTTQNIAVGSPLPGIVVWVIEYDKLGKQVKEGDVLFRLDDRQQQAELEMRQAMLQSAQVQLDRLKQMPRPEEVEPIEARLQETKANLEDQQDQFERARRLYARRTLSEEDYSRRKFALQVAQEQLRKAEADLRLIKAGSWAADIAVSEAAVRQSQAQVRQVQTDLERLVIKAPVTGQLLQLNVRKGEFVGAQPGQTLILLGTVSDYHVRVDIDEYDAPRFRPGMPATGYLRGNTEYKYPLEFVRVEPYIVPKKSLTGDNSERVDTRVLQVIYKLQSKPDDQHRVYIGQQMDVFIDTAKQAPPG